MRNEITNLLPLPRQHALSRDYVIRLAVVVAFMLTALVLTAAVLLLPSYVFLTKNENAKKNYLASIESTTSSADEKGLSTRLSALSADTATLIALGHAPSISTVIREILSISRPGIVLSGFSYTSAVGKKSSTLVLSGIAATRDALRNYQLSMGSAPSVLSADLPVSAYAKDSQITFAITITLAL